MLFHYQGLNYTQLVHSTFSMSISEVSECFLILTCSFLSWVDSSFEVIFSSLDLTGVTIFFKSPNPHLGLVEHYSYCPNICLCLTLLFHCFLTLVILLSKDGRQYELSTLVALRYSVASEVMRHCLKYHCYRCFRGPFLRSQFVSSRNHKPLCMNLPLKKRTFQNSLGSYPIHCMEMSSSIQVRGPQVNSS